MMHQVGDKQETFMIGNAVHCCKRRGYRRCNRTPKSSDLVKIRAKSLNIRAKSVEIGSQNRCMCFYFVKWHPNSKCRRFFLFLEIMFFVLFGLVGGNLAKFGKNGT